MNPLVSVCVTTYCHEKYLAQTLDSILGQQVDFPIEILIHDDHSPDGTEDIIRRYAKQYPDVVLPLYEEENQYSQNIPINETFNFPRARGKYIALCEGDDYWLDRHKLARQVAHMEQDDSCTFCFTNGMIHDETGERPDRVFLPYYEHERPWLKEQSGAYSLSEIARLSFIPTASFLFRVDALRRLPEEFLTRPCQHGDLRMKLYLTAAGHAWYEDVIGCMYRENVPTSAFQVWKKEKRAQLFARCQSVVDMVGDVNRFSGGTAQEALQSVSDHYLRVMAHNAPDLKTLNSGDLGRVYRSLPIRERLRCSLRLMLPEGLAASLAKAFRPKGE